MRKLKENLWVVILSTAVVWLCYSFFLDRSPIVSSEWNVITPHVKQGDDFEIKYDIVWSNDCTVTNFRVIVDGAGFIHARDREVRDVVKGVDSFVVSVNVPSNAAVGQALYRGVVQYQCNIVQAVWPLERELLPREFTIYGKDEPCPEEKPVSVRSYCRSSGNVVVE